MNSVYFTDKLSSEGLISIFKSLGVNLEGRVAVKLHSGEKGNQNFIKPEFVREFVEFVNGTVVECNTAYNGERNTSEKHKKLMDEHGWTKYFDVDIMDEDGDIEIPIENGIRINKNYVGKNIKNYDSLIVLSHFKGHPMGGFGGALKQLSIGCASSRGKAYIHGAGTTDDPEIVWNNLPKQDEFLESMADAASSVDKMFKGNVVYINIMMNMSVDCDCCKVAENPCMEDIGILASLNPLALDQACIDIIYNSKDKGAPHLIERIERQHGTYILDCMERHGYTRDYKIINI